MCKGKQCPNFEDCKCKKDEVNYDDPKWKGIIPSTTSPHNLLNKESSEELEVFSTSGDVIYKIDLGD